jgi:hypothetical protein
MTVTRSAPPIVRAAPCSAGASAAGGPSPATSAARSTPGSRCGGGALRVMPYRSPPSAGVAYGAGEGAVGGGLGGLAAALARGVLLGRHASEDRREQPGLLTRLGGEVLSRPPELLEVLRLGAEHDEAGAARGGLAQAQEQHRVRLLDVHADEHDRVGSLDRADGALRRLD